MNYGTVKTHDIANGEGIRTSLFVSGCRHCCEGCFQPETWDFGYGQEYTAETESYILGTLESWSVDGLTLLGGEPFEPENQRVLVGLLGKAKKLFPAKNIWAYSGYTWEDLTAGSSARCEVTDEILSYVDVLVDGKFMLSLKDPRLKFRGSSNQRVIDVGKSLERGEAVPYEFRCRLSGTFA